MSRKHFESIAAAIKQQVDALRAVDRQIALGTVLDTANRLADCFSEANLRFDRSRFLSACGF